MTPNRYRPIALAALAVVLAVTPTANAQETGPAAGSSDKMSEMMMKQMQERLAAVTQPGEHHAALARFLGDWDVQIKLVMPGVPEEAWDAKANYHWLVDGRWMGQKLAGTFMDMPIESFTILGFDAYAKNHVAASVSSFDTAMIVARGIVVDPTGKVSVTYGTLNEYTTEELNKPFKSVVRVVDADHHVMEIWDLGIGAEGAMVLEYSYSRAKG